MKFSIFEYAAQKVLKFEKLKKERSKKIEELGMAKGDDTTTG